MSLFESAIGLLAPPQCVNCGTEGSALCIDCAGLLVPFGEKCWRCNALSPSCRTCPKCRASGTPHSVWISTHHEDLARDLLGLFKFRHLRVAANPIVDLMAQTFLSFNSNQEITARDYLVIPIPTASSRTRERGFGHSELLAKKIASRLHMDQSPALHRLGQSRQLGSKRDIRLSQLRGSFLVKNPRRIYNRNILLIDDVVTTGGTLIEATKTLRAAGAQRVDALLFAKRL